MTYTLVDGRPTIDKDPTATLDYIFDWTAWLAESADSIASAVVTAAGATVLASSNTSDLVTARVSGGVIGQTVALTCTITTAAASPRIDLRTVYLRIVAR